MAAPVNVKIKTPSCNVPDWEFQAKKWKTINSDIQGNPDFYPLTIKGMYVIGVIYTICESVSILLSHSKAIEVTYLPAFGVFSSAVELLGRCLNGNTNTSNSVKDLQSGYLWLAKYENHRPLNITDIFLETAKNTFTIEELIALRHFSVHGQATAKHNQHNNVVRPIDSETLSHMPPKLAHYWFYLVNDEIFCNKLAKANIIPLREWPVFQSLSMFEKDINGRYKSVCDIFNLFNWNLYPTENE
jgi:hypothetical protein